MKILIAPDSFKDCMSAMEVARALEKGLQKALPEAAVLLVPMADGGEGTVESIIDSTGGERREVRVKNPLLRDINSFYGLDIDGSLAVIEMAAASGLELLCEEERNPWLTSTYGTGQLIAHALDQGCRRILLGIGGSATNDCGTGMARALGVKFLDEQGQEVAHGGGALDRIREINLEGIHPALEHAVIQVACDVDNPLTGPQGASHVYGPQKGADAVMVEKLDTNLGHMATLIREQLGKDINNVPGAGAAGGLGAGLLAFLGAELVKGVDMVADTLGLEEQLKDADLVITGEGRMDAQTRFGKTPFGVAQLAAKHGIPVIGVTGSLDADAVELYNHGFSALLSIQEKPLSLDEALVQAPELLERCGERIARLVKINL